MKANKHLFVAISILLATTVVTAACSRDDKETKDPCDNVFCGERGVCNPETGACDCETGYSGDSCEECDTGYFFHQDECIPGECAKDSDCDDGNACNGLETCNENNECVSGHPVDCGENAHCVDPEGTCECNDGFVKENGLCISALITDFEDLSLDPESFWNGSDETGYFETGHASLNNYYYSDFGYWEGFAYSNTTDTTTPGYENQHSAVTGSGAEGSEIYAVGYYSTFYDNPPPTITLTNTEEGYLVSGLYVTNTTYAYLAMSEGDGVSKKFGGTTGDDPDWFLLTITGLDQHGETTGTVEFYLADFRFEDNEDNYIIGDWTWVDLTSLGPVTGLQFTLSSSDTGDFGMNTPAYFAIDTIIRK